MIIDITIIFISSLLLSLVFNSFKLPKFLAYLIAGFISKMFSFNDLHLNPFSRMGILILLFCLGLELSTNQIKSLVPFLLPSFLTIFVVFGSICLCLLTFLPFKIAGFLAIAVALSSTAIIVVFLKDNKMVNTTLGKYALSLLIAQDLVSIISLLLLESGNPVTFTIAFLGFISIILFVKNFINRILMYVYYNNRDLFFLLVLSILFVLILLSNKLGLSEELGAFLAGILFANSQLIIKIETYMGLVKNIFLIFFFAEIGHGLDFKVITSQYKVILVYLLVFLSVKIITTFLSGIFFFKKSTSAIISLVSSNVSESSFIILQKLFLLKLLTVEQVKIFDVVFVLMIALSPFLIGISALFKSNSSNSEPLKHSPRVIICGTDLFALAIAKHLEKFNIAFSIISDNIHNVLICKNHQFPCLFGNIFSLTERNKLGVTNVKTFFFTECKHEMLSQLLILKDSYPETNMVVLTKDQRSYNILTSYNIKCINIPSSGTIHEILVNMDLSEQKIFH